MSDWRTLLRHDAERVWHPYGALPAAQPQLPVTGASGVRLELADGRELIDAMASWWCAIHGYRVGAIDRAVGEQLDRMAHVMFGGLTHRGAIELADRLIAITPPGLERVFLADSGSVSVEVAIKLTLQYQRAVGRPERTRLMTVRGGYHGDTAGAMALCDPVGGMHSLFTGLLPQQLFAPRPPGGLDGPADDAWTAEVEELAERHADEIAGIVVEPVVQGAGGMHFYPPDCLRVLRETCDRHGLLLVLDEIATGFGRTGQLFACEHAGVRPDVMCVGKALTGGYMTAAAMLCTPEVAAAVSGGEGKGLMHGPTFMGNPLACAAALASLELLDDGAWRGQVGAIEAALGKGLAPARALDHVADVRVLGAIGVIELEREVDVAEASAAAVELGVWIRPFRNLIYCMPPYVIGDADLARVAQALCAAAAAG